MDRRYVVLYGQQGHPLAGSRGELLEHRKVLYEKLGPGTHPCHWCGKSVTWTRGARGAPTRDNLHTEHLDGDGTNNAPENLVPTCQPCNSSAGYRSDRIMSTDLVRVRPNGMRTRAVERTCSHCGATFLREPSARGLYCSKPCADASRKREVCRRGHPRSGRNLMASGACRECQRIATERYRAKKG